MAVRPITRDGIITSIGTITATRSDSNMKLRTFITYLFCIAASAFFATAAAADRRVALVIGNAAYKNAPTLTNTVNRRT